MGKGLIVYFSQGGTTARVAESIAGGLAASAYQVDLHNLKDGRPPNSSDYDLLGVGSPTYYFRPPFNVMDYVSALPDLAGQPAFVFVLHGTYRGDAGNTIIHALARRRARFAGYFHCHGADFFLGYLKRGYFFSPDHPTTEELAQAEAFGCEVASNVAAGRYAEPARDPSPGMVYRLERLLVSKWLSRQVYSRFFTASAKKCTACGVCTKLCPRKNIAEDKDGHPIWGRDCLLCLTCELKCPKDAITSVVDHSLFRPFILYNVWHASRDSLLDFRRVVHSQGRMRAV